MADGDHQGSSDRDDDDSIGIYEGRGYQDYKGRSKRSNVPSEDCAPDDEDDLEGTNRPRQFNKQASYAVQPDASDPAGRTRETMI